jgi:hypothetical protein
LAPEREQSLEEFVASTIPLGAEIGPEDLENLLDELHLSKQGIREQQILLGAVREWAAGEATLAWEPGGWKVRIAGPGVQTAVSAGLLWAALTALGVGAAIPVAIIPALIPTLFAIERVHLKKSDEEVVASLFLHDKVQLGTPQQLYDDLPPSVREELGYLDFVDLLEKLVEAGRAERKGEKTYLLEADGKRRFRVTFA